MLAEGQYSPLGSGEPSIFSTDFLGTPLITRLLSSNHDGVGFAVRPLAAAAFLAIECASDVIKSVLAGIHVKPTAAEEPAVPIAGLAINGLVGNHNPEAIAENTLHCMVGDWRTTLRSQIMAISRAILAEGEESGSIALNAFEEIDEIGFELIAAPVSLRAEQIGRVNINNFAVGIIDTGNGRHIGKDWKGKGFCIV